MKELKQLLRRRYSVAGGMPASHGEVPQRWRETLAAELAAIQSVFEQADSQDFARACDILNAADEVFVTGFQSVRGLTEDHAKRLSLARGRVRCLSPHDSMLSQWLEADDGGNSCLLLVDVVPYASESQALAKIARAQGRQIIVVSDEYCHWSREVADAVLYAPSATGLFLESTLGLNATLALLVHTVAQQNPEAAGQRLRQWKLHSRRLGLF